MHGPSLNLRVARPIKRGIGRHTARNRGGRVILFLDYDGVLHPDPCTDAGRLFENAPRLAQALEPFAGIGIVLSTSWRTKRTEAELLDPLPAGVRQRVLGFTPCCSDFSPPTELIPYRRHAECLQWLKMHAMADSPWWALDDRADWFMPYCENLIECDPRVGFDAHIAARLGSALTVARNRIGGKLDLMLA